MSSLSSSSASLASPFSQTSDGEIAFNVEGFLLLATSTATTSTSQAQPPTRLPVRHGDGMSYLPTPPCKTVAESKEVEPATTTKPSARYGQTLTLVSADAKKKHELFMIGGTVYHDYYNDVWAYDVAGHEWRRVDSVADTTKPSPRFGHASVLLPDGVTIMLFGGSNNSVWSSDTFMFDTQTATWSELIVTPHPTERRGHTMVSIGDSVYLFGGQSSVSQRDVWRFDTKESTWCEVKPALPSSGGPEARYCHTAVAYEGSMVVWGGHGSWGCVESHVYALDTADHTWRQWETCGVAPCKRFGHSAVTSAGRMVVFGGMDVYPSGTSFNDMHMLDFLTRMWHPIDIAGSVPRGRRLHSIVDCLGRFLLFGGWNGNDLFSDTFEVVVEPWSLKELLRRKIVLENVPYHDDDADDVDKLVANDTEEILVETVGIAQSQ
eukprot:PhM_4_TR17492/c0_g1_i1/m.44199